MLMTTSFDTPISTTNDIHSLHDVIASDLAPSNILTAKSDVQKEIHRILSVLSSQERKILEWYYGINGNPEHTYEEIGNKLNVTRERIRQLKNRAEEKLKKAVRNKNFTSSYWDL